MFLVALVCLFVCLFVCGQHYSKSYERIGMKFYGEVLGMLCCKIFNIKQKINSCSLPGFYFLRLSIHSHVLTWAPAGYYKAMSFVCLFYLTHTTYHISHISHNTQTLLGMTEFVKHGTEHGTGYNKC